MPVRLTRRAALLAALLAALPALAACEARPRVFAARTPRPRDPPRLVDVRDFAVADKLGVFVAGVDGAPEALDSALRPALVERLLAHDVAASAQSANRASYILEARAYRAAGGGRVLAWRLVDSDDLPVALMDQAVPGRPEAWRRGDPALAEALAAGAAPRLAALIRDASPPPAPAARPAAPGARVAVGAVAGAPGGGGPALADAARAALAAAGFRVAPAGPGVPRLDARVAVERRGPEDVLSVDWRVRAADGRDLGTVALSGAVPAGSLDGPWGAIADRIAESVLPGITDLLAPPAGGSIGE